MIRSKSISDYFEVDLTQITPEIPLTFDIHFYFSLNDHIVLIKRAGESPRLDLIDKYRSRGISRVWILNRQREAFEAYLNPQSAPTVPISSPETVPEATPEAAGTPSPSEARKAPQTEAGAFISAVMKSPDLNAKQKEAVVGEASQELLKALTTPDSLAAQTKATAQARKTIEDILDSLADEANQLVADLWKLSKIDPELEHSVNVATYAVIFAMAFGRIDPSLISDLALSGLLHDVGISQISHAAALTPWKSMPTELLRDYARHVDQTLNILNLHAGQVPNRVKVVITQHHEKFDGSGYPRALSGFKIDDIAQLLAMADVLDSIVSGQWDGQEYPLKQAFKILDQVEKNSTFPEYFNPEVFSAVIRWIHSTDHGSSIGTVSDVVGKRAQEIIKNR